MIKKYNMEHNIVVISFYTTPIEALRKLMPDVPAAWLNSSIAITENDPISYMASVMDVIQPVGTVFSPSYAKGSLGYNTVRTLMYRGVSTWIWTVNDITDFNRYYLMGVRGITTNYSQWVKDYIKNVEVTVENGIATVTGETYSGAKKDLTKSAALKVVDDGGTGISFDPSTGILSGNAGTAKFFFAVSTATSTRDKYWLVTEPVSLRIEGTAQTTVEQTAEQSGPEETSAPEPDVTTTAETAKKGCGAFAAGPAAMAVAVVSATAVALRKRKNED